MMGLLCIKRRNLVLIVALGQLKAIVYAALRAIKYSLVQKSLVNKELILYLID